MVLSARDRRLRQRFKEVGYLNHHIRNSLAVIEMAEGYISEADQRLEMVKKASLRIRRCVEKISREEDCEINEQSPRSLEVLRVGNGSEYDYVHEFRLM